MRYAPLAPDDPQGRALFLFAGAALPPEAAGTSAWGAWSGDRLTGAVMIERAGSCGMISGPVVLDVPDPLEIGAGLVSALMDSVRALGSLSLFVRPQGLDRVWIRFGFVPAPESMLPESLEQRPGTGLFIWREHRVSAPPRSDRTPFVRP